MKTVRFTQVVEKSGRPEVYLPFLAPERDRVLQAAAKKARVLAVHQQVKGTKKDFGTIGLSPDTAAELLIFPRSLQTFAGRRVVGIDYDLVDQPPAGKPRPASAPRPAAKTAPKRSAQRRSDPDRRKPVDTKPPPAKIGRTPPSAEAPNATTPESSETGWLREIQLAARELKAGKVVAAHERLNALLAAHGLRA